MDYTTQSDDYSVQVSMKFGHSLQHMVNVRGKTVDELMHHLDKLTGVSGFVQHAVGEITNADIPSPQQAAQTVQNVFPQTQQIQPGVVTPYPQQPQQPQTYGQPPSQELCAHGLRWEFKQGQKNGKEWAGNFCAAPRDGINGVPRCAPKFFG